MAPRNQGLLRRSSWLFLAAGLVAVSAWLMTKPSKRPGARRKSLDFPRYQSAEDYMREDRRKTLKPPIATSQGNGGAEDQSEENLDPLHVAIGGGDVSLVLEASTIESSPIGKMLLRCLSARRKNSFEETKRKLGIDLFEQVDRLAIGMKQGDAEGVVALTGDFEGANFSALEGLEIKEDYGPHATLYGQTEILGVWNDEMILVGPRKQVKAAVDRLEGKQEATEPIEPGEAYGEMYGTLSGEVMAEMVPDHLRERVKRAARRVMVHVDARDDLLLVANVSGKGQEVSDLGTTIGAALALGRMRAVDKDNPILSALLDESRVIPHENGFQLEMALPLDIVQRQLGECAK